MKLNDTIAAVSTPPGRGGIGIVRISGPQAFGISEAVLSIGAEPVPRRATLGRLLDDEGHLIDEVVATRFRAPRSYTAEDLVEISCHGAPVILGHCLSRALKAGARLAEPGEFTLRAFLNGRLDLPQAEAVRDLIEATTLYQARVAARQAEGSISRRLAPIKTQLLELIALLEAGIDFAEDDISIASTEELLRRLRPVLESTRAFAASFQYGSLVRDGFSLAIVGLPNAGKSSLFNRLLEQDRAIVTPIPGTTRDLVSETVSFEGIPVRLVDTAGIRETGEVIEQLGIERTWQAMSDADLTLVVMDGSRSSAIGDEELVTRARATGKYLIVSNKSDLVGFCARKDSFPVSALTGDGIQALRAAILARLAPSGELELEGSFVTNVRHADLLREAGLMLAKAEESVMIGNAHELILLDLYCALAPLDAITGSTTADDVLNRIFAKFCIGK